MCVAPSAIRVPSAPNPNNMVFRARVRTAGSQSIAYPQLADAMSGQTVCHARTVCESACNGMSKKVTDFVLAEGPETDCGWQRFSDGGSSDVKYPKSTHFYWSQLHRRQVRHPLGRIRNPHHAHTRQLKRKVDWRGILDKSRQYVGTRGEAGSHCSGHKVVSKALPKVHRRAPNILLRQSYLDRITVIIELPCTRPVFAARTISQSHHGSVDVC